MNDVLLIDKHPGVTSFTILKEIKRILNITKLGHSGTLDKFASGLLIICTGWSRKLTKYFLESDKRYIGIIKLGIVTDTYDSEGEITGYKETSNLNPQSINKIPGLFTGCINQVPPLFSAKKIKGTRASDLIRKGKKIVLQEIKINIRKLDILKIDLDNSMITIDVSCSKGTYIRALARDIGEYLGTGGHLVYLRRIACGDFTIENAATLDEVKKFACSKISNKKFLLKPEETLSCFSSIKINNHIRNKIYNGAPFQRNDIVNIDYKGNNPFSIFDEAGNLIAIADIDITNWSIKYLNVFNRNDLNLG